MSHFNLKIQGPRIIPGGFEMRNNGVSRSEFSPEEDVLRREPPIGEMHLPTRGGSVANSVPETVLDSSGWSSPLPVGLHRRTHLGRYYEPENMIYYSAQRITQFQTNWNDNQSRQRESFCHLLFIYYGRAIFSAVGDDENSFFFFYPPPE